MGLCFASLIYRKGRILEILSTDVLLLLLLPFLCCISHTTISYTVVERIFQGKVAAAAAAA